MRASIIITSFNRSELLMYGLGSLLKQNLSDVEILVLNDGNPNDGTEGVCELFKNDLDIKYFSTKRDHTRWRIPGYAINYGIKKSQGDIIFISCAEMYHLDNTVESMIGIVNNNPKALAIPVGKDDEGTYLNKLRNHIKTTDDDYNCLPPLVNIRFPFFMGLKKEEIVKIGGYDEDFTGVGFDDNDIVYRLNGVGCHHIGTPSRVIHLYHQRLPCAGEIASKLSYNMRIFNEKRGVLNRNINKDWGNNF